MSNTPVVAWSFALPSATATRPSATIGLCQCTEPDGSVANSRPLVGTYTWIEPLPATYSSEPATTVAVTPVHFDQTRCRRSPFKSSASVTTSVARNDHLPFTA